MGYPIEETPFAEQVRHKLQRLRGEEYELARDPLGGEFMTTRRIPGEPPMRSLSDCYVAVNHLTGRLRSQEMRPEPQRDQAVILQLLIELAAICERSAVDLGLTPRI